MAVWVQVVFWLALISGSVCFQCPRPCFCYPNFDAAQTITVDCRGQDLFEIPFPIPPETSSLDVSNNLIEYVRTIDLPDELPSLRFLQLQNNELIDIEPGALSNLPNLEVLRLTNNQVRRLRNGTFNGLSNLQTLEAYNFGLTTFEEGLFSPLTNLVTLDLSSNNLQVIPSGTFSGFQRLQRLYLSDNFLTTVQANAISNLPILSMVNLAFNQLRALDTDALSNVPRLISLTLQQNPIECACDAMWLYSFLSTNNLNGPVCAQPEEFRGRALLDLATQEFCALPTATISTPPVAIASGATLQVDCTATGAPPPTFSWSRNGMTFDPNDGRVMISSGSLIISNVSDSDSGEYHCIVTNSAGQVSASVPVAVVTVGNVSVVEAVRRDNVVLDCVDMREVEAPLVWLFNSSVLELSDKHVVLENGSLLIRAVDLADMGDYVCEVGTLMITQSLVVSAAPEIVVFTEGECSNPQCLRIDSDAEVNLICSVFGIPPPQVEWFFAGSRLSVETPPPPSSMVGGTLTAIVVLNRPDPNQSGNYTCVGTSALGTVERTIKVDVRLIASEGTNPTIDAIHFVGDTAVLECDLGNRFEPETIVLWRRRSGLDLPADRTVFADRNTTLIIEDLMFPADRDGYECLLTPPSGIRARLTYDLIINQPAVITKEIGIPIVRAVAGSNVSLSCFTEASPGASYQWLVNNTALDQSFIVNRSLIEIIGQQVNRNFGVRLNITAVREGDNGFYNCSAMNIIPDVEGVFQDSYVVELQIQRLPYFTYQPEPTAVVAGSTATLLCGGRGSPPPTLTWFVKRGNITVPVTPDLRRVITNHALLILRAEPTDEGHYFCEISSPLQTRTSPTADLRVYTPVQLGTPLPPEVRVPVDTRNVTLDCFGSGDPAPVVHWLRGDDLLPISGQQVLLDNGSLVLLSVERNDGGVYRCRLANVAGMVFYNVTLTVLTLPDTLVEPQMVTANVGCQVTFQCTDGGRVLADSSEIQWSRRGQRLEEGEGVSILSTGELVLSDLSVEDAGNYTCTLWSELGSRAHTALLVVEDPIFASGAPVAPPTITSPTPSTQSLSLLATANFICFASGFPPPEIVWLRDNLPLPRLRRVNILNGALLISELRITDNATYTCVASNALGSESMDFVLLISVPPSFDVRPVTQTLLLGEVLTLNCSASGVPPPQIMWLHNNTMLVSQDNPPGRVYIDPLSGGLSVNRVTASDAGLYTCVARNQAGVAETAVPVFVQDITIRPNITVPPESVSTVAGLSVTLDCEVFGLPTPSVSWLKDGLTLDLCDPNTPDIVCVSEDSVFIQSADVEDGGRYTCVAENSAGVAVYEAFVSVEPPMSFPVFDVYPAPAWLVNGSSLKLDCQAVGDPAPNISWLLDFDPINTAIIDCSINNPISELAVCSNGSLIVPVVDFSDEGFYTCVADNGLGMNQVSVSVDVGVASSEMERGLLSPPTLSNTPTIVLPLLPGNNITLDCSAEGNPPPIISWSRDGVLIDFSTIDNQFQLPNGSLLLTLVSVSDGGRYTCLAENSAGTAQVSFQLDFDELGRLATGNLAPVITMDAKNLTVMEGSKVDVQCVAKGQPEPTVVWQHNGSVVYESELRKVAARGRILSVSSAQMAHSGSYTCLALNKQGSSQSELFLSVIPRPVPPALQLTPTDTRVLVGESFTLSCFSEAPLAWYRGNESVDGLSGHKILCDGDTLLVTDVKELGSVEYHCVASSLYGVSVSYALITVTSSVIVSEWQVELGSSVRLTCEGGGWSRFGATVKSSSVVIVADELMFLLSARLSDEGEYYCSGQLHYLYVTVTPVIADGGALKKVQAGDNVQLHCMASGKPRPSIIWHKGDELLEPTMLTNVLSDGSLLLLSVTESGVYTCLARNIAGEAKNSIYLFVL